jgi:hypothetical protein
MASLNRIAGGLKDGVAAPMLRQSLHERFSIRSTAFHMAVLGNLIVQRLKPTAALLGPTAIQRIILDDASTDVMSKSNAESFPPWQPPRRHRRCEDSYRLRPAHRHYHLPIVPNNHNPGQDHLARVHRGEPAGRPRATGHGLLKPRRVQRHRGLRDIVV